MTKLTLERLIIATIMVVALTFAFTGTTSNAASRSSLTNTKIASVEYYRLTGCMVTMTNGKRYRGNTVLTGNLRRIWWTTAPKRGERQNITGDNADRLSEALSIWEETHSQ